ncbi:MAG: glycoside hydrolase family 3 C-terminal domain-containing protein [Bifidobacteriaceae bacterium]|jgi:beta-glucosidase-like glycosyl hydrolase|nr:glycoside hydrolase family 3 C-terminal domain-containing protein [Bifidobacteriaceae bacterium]
MAIAASFLAAGLPGAPAGPALAADPAPYLDTTLPAEVRAADLVSRMTFAEKSEQLRASTETARPAAGIPRLGVASYNYWNEALHGVARGGYNSSPTVRVPGTSVVDYGNGANQVWYNPTADTYVLNPATGTIGTTWYRVPPLSPNNPAYNDVGVSTELPIGLAMGSTWNTEAVEVANSYVGDEARAYYNFRNKGLTYWSPTVNMDRDPRWGRAEETYGEDPYLAGEIGGAFVTGLQGDDGTGYLKSVATPKHFFANNADATRHHRSSNVTEREMREYYTPQFAALYGTYGAKSGMTSYNAVNILPSTTAVPSSANKFAVETMQRRTWGFDGFITSDCGAITDVLANHYFVANRAEQVGISLKAGTDIDCSAGSQYSAGVFDAIAAGTMTEDDLDINLIRVFKVRFELGEFDTTDAFTGAAYQKDQIAFTGAHADASRTLSNEAPVLLKNDGGVLPLPVPAATEPPKKIAVVGYLGGEETHGNYTPYLSPVMGTQDQSAYAALQREYGADNVVYIPGIVDRDYLANGTGGIWQGSWTGRDHALDPSATSVDDVSAYLPPDWGTPLDTNPALANAVAGFQSGTSRGGRLVTPQKPRLGDSTNTAAGLLQFLNAGDVLLGTPVLPKQLRDEDVWGWGGRSNPYAPTQWTDTGVWEGSFELDVTVEQGATQLRLVQSGIQPSDPINGLANTAAPTSTRDQLQIIDPQGHFEVHVGDRAGAVVATIPADGTVRTVPYSGPTGTTHLFFDYINDAYQPEDFTTTSHTAGGTTKTDQQWIQDADLVVAVVGTRTREAYEGYDRASLDLSHAQDELVAEVAALNPNTVAWIQSVEQVNIESFKDDVPGIIWVSYNGQWQGDALADIISGDVNPSGHLPMTWYTDVAELPHILDYTITPTDGLKGRTYQYFTGGVTYPFGHGLSYSTFTYANARVSAATASPDDTVTVSVDVTNPSARPGKAVIQLYATSPGYSPGSPDRPTSQLRGFTKVTVAPSSTQEVSIDLKVSDLWFWDDDADRQVVDAGQWTLRIGESSAAATTTTLTVAGARTPAIDQVVAIPDGAVLDTRAPKKVIHAGLSATRADQSFYDLDSPGVTVVYDALDRTVAAVDSAGVVTPVGPGVTQVRATVTADGASKSTTFPVVVVGENPTPFPRPVVQLPDITCSLDEAKAGVHLGAEVIPDVSPAAATYRLAFDEENGAGATVRDDGLFTAAQAGLTRVTATVTVPGFARPVSVSANVTVTDASKSSLSDKVADAELGAAGFTGASWTAYQSALTQARRVLTNPAATQAQVDAALAALDSAHKGLAPRAELAGLSSLIGTYATLVPQVGVYTPGSWTRLESAVAAARRLLHDPANVSVAAAESASDAILAALNGLERVPVVSPDMSAAQKEALTAVLGALITDLGALPAGDFTAASYAALGTALAAARAVSADPASTPAQVTAAIQNLTKAAAGLAKVPDGVAGSVAKVNGAQSRLSLVKGRSQTLVAAAYTTAGDAKAVSWKSSNTKVATVNKAGRVKAKAVGTATLTASAGGRLWKVAVKVVAKRPASYKSTAVSATVPRTMKTGATVYVTSKYTPASAVGIAVRYASSNSAVLSVTKAGRLVANKAGKATVTVRTQYSSKKYTVTVN